MKKILWVGDAVVQSGFAACTHAACAEFHARGWDVHIIGLNYQGDPHDYPYKIYIPRVPFSGTSDGFGVRRLPELMEQIRPDVVVLLNDPWNVPHYLNSVDKFNAGDDNACKPLMAAWLAVDAQNQKSALELTRLDKVIVWTEFAAKVLRDSGYGNDLSIVPLGVDSKIFHTATAEERSAARAKYTKGLLTDEHFVIGSVGRNQPRKRIDLTLQFFKEIHDCVPRARLLLHVAPTGDVGCDIDALRRYYGLENTVLCSSPPIGHGAKLEEMQQIYSMLDLFVSTSEAEGWCLPALEAMACGVPCVLPRNSAFQSWAGPAAELINCPTSVVCAPQLAYTIGAVPDKEHFVNTVCDLANDDVRREDMSARGLRLTEKYSWKKSGEMFADEIEQALEAHYG